MKGQREREREREREGEREREREREGGRWREVSRRMTYFYYIFHFLCRLQGIFKCEDEQNTRWQAQKISCN